LDHLNPVHCNKIRIKRVRKKNKSLSRRRKKRMKRILMLIQLDLKNLKLRNSNKSTIKILRKLKTCLNLRILWKIYQKISQLQKRTVPIQNWTNQEDLMGTSLMTRNLKRKRKRKKRKKLSCKSEPKQLKRKKLNNSKEGIDFNNKCSNFLLAEKPKSYPLSTLNHPDSLTQSTLCLEIKENPELITKT
jgi:hypothetical protein